MTRLDTGYRKGNRHISDSLEETQKVNNENNYNIKKNRNTAQRKYENAFQYSREKLQVNVALIENVLVENFPVHKYIIE